ncbi:MAG: long-chain fatty acid--CoA ligase [Mesorhizobium sp.]|nr:long-chain fatty acid--CoA ligase [Mesorhizobium sp.]
MTLSNEREQADRFTPTPRRFAQTAAERGSAVAYRTLQESGWRTTSWTEYGAEVARVARALVALGVKKGDVICILGFNRPEWTTMALGAMMVGAAPAGIYFTSSPEEIAYILDHSETPILLAEKQEHFDRVAKHAGKLKHLRHVVMMRGVDAADPLQMGWNDFIARGEARFQPEVETRLAGLQRGDTGTLIYTSGTTGPPKAVVLSHGALAWTAWTLKQMFNIDGGHRLVSYLPLAHIAEAMNSIHSHAAGGFEVWFARSMDELGSHLKDARPTVFFGVPRVWQKIHDTLQQRLSAATGTKAKLARWSIDVGRAAATRKLAGEPVGLLLGLQHRLADRLVLAKIRDAIGLDKCPVPVSGAAPISTHVLEFFAALGIVVLEVYGQSEDCGPTTFNVAGATKLGTVGKPIPGLELKIAPDDEILVRSPSLFDGYAKDPAATAATLVDGWMKTGDLGRLDADGYLTIIGRKKDILITSGGKNITPANLEGDLMDIPLVEHAVVVGEGRNYLTALLTLGEDKLKDFAAVHGLSGDLRSDPRVLAEIQQGIDALNPRHARVEQIRRFAILPRSLTMADNELTPTLKVKRNIVVQNHAGVVERMYAEAAPVA